LVAVKPSLTKHFREFEHSERAKNYRWLYFLAIAVAVGGKVANSSTKLAEIDSRTRGDRRVIVRASARYYRKTVFAGKTVLRPAFNMLNFLISLIVLKINKFTTNAKNENQ
jgi:hypothetical protein